MQLKGIIVKKLEEKNLQLDLTSSFYNGEEKEEKEIAKLFHEAYIINLVGNDSVNLGLKLGILSKSNIIHIKKVPHAQVIL